MNYSQRYSFQSKYERCRFYRIISLTEPGGQLAGQYPSPILHLGKGSLGVRCSYFIGLFGLESSLGLNLEVERWLWLALEGSISECSSDRSWIGKL
ncbi:hypothetical protein [Paenibacillus sp. PDC88]|uniref:hypothetical protein n=1 Tax=Paenibacillus sp. PDC88 TaxID=1884375 RepID=UPI00115FA0FC|nr:hypothetical protein [Paenibacillus sp. PDC88]